MPILEDNMGYFNLFKVLPNNITNTDEKEYRDSILAVKSMFASIISSKNPTLLAKSNDDDFSQQYVKLF